MRWRCCDDAALLIRPATDSDAETVARPWTEGYTGADPGGRSTPYEPAELLAVARNGRPFVAVENGETVGIVVFFPPGAKGTAVARPGEAELGRLVVAGVARVRGIGRALSELCAELARQAGARGIVLWSRPYQVEGHRLYESLGYRRRPERDDEDADGPRLVFRLDLGD
jgi:ribosomal protein S18 acetylase RimI-like enzyme